MMINTYHTLERKPISLLETARVYTSRPTLISPEGSFHFEEREDKDGCPSPTNHMSSFPPLRPLYIFMFTSSTQPGN